MIYLNKLFFFHSFVSKAGLHKVAKRDESPQLNLTQI